MNLLFSGAHPTRMMIPAVALIGAALFGCGGGSGDNGGAAVPPITPVTPVTPTPSLNLSASTRQAAGGGAPVTLSADSGANTVAWQLNAGSPGSLSAASGNSINYLPPSAPVSTITPVVITATAGGVSKTLNLALYPDPGTPGLSLVAGSLGEFTVLDGTGTAARFNNIESVVSDSTGGLIVADAGSIHDGGQDPDLIRKVTSAGVVTTFIRPPVGHADGDAAHAKMAAIITSLAAGPDNSIYTLEHSSDANYVRVLRADGSMTTLATLSNINGGDRLLSAADGTGSLYALAQTHVDRINADGSTTLIAGALSDYGNVDGTGAAARFDAIQDGALDKTGNLYVLDNAGVRKISQSGVVTTLASSAGAFTAPSSIAVDANSNLLVLDIVQATGGDLDYVVRQVSQTGVITKLYEGSMHLGTNIPPLPTSTRFNTLRIGANGAVILGAKGKLEKIDSSGAAVAFAGLEGDSDVEVDGPAATARFSNPGALNADLHGYIYVSDNIGFSGGNQIGISGLSLRKIAPDGTVSTVLYRNHGSPSGIAIDSNGNIFASFVPPSSTLYAGAAGGEIYKTTPDGNETLFAGSPDLPASIDGQGSNARFTSPSISGIDASDNLYITDSNGTKTVYRKVTPDGLVSTVASLPSGLGAAPDGNVYTVDTAQNLITRTTPAGVSTVIAGVAGKRATLLGPLPGGLDAPHSLVPTGPGSFALISGVAVIRLVVPH